MIENVLLDLDDTLLSFRKSEKKAIKKTLAAMGLRRGKSVIRLYSAVNAQMWKKLEMGEMTREQILVERFRILFRELGVSADAFKAKQLYEENLKNSVFFVRGAKSFLKKAHKKYRLYLVSNGTAAVQDRRIEIAGIARYFNGIFISERVGFVKPDKAFFDACFSFIPDFSRDKTVIVGDSLSSDIAGGINAGIRTCLFIPLKEAKKQKNGEGVVACAPDYRVKNFKRLLLLLKRI